MRRVRARASSVACVRDASSSAATDAVGVPLQISAPCKQTIYKQTGWRGAPELSNGAGWRQRAQAMAAKQCRLRAAGGKKF